MCGRMPFGSAQSRTETETFRPMHVCVCGTYVRALCNPRLLIISIRIDTKNCVSRPKLNLINEIFMRFAVADLISSRVDQSPHRSQWEFQSGTVSVHKWIVCIWYLVGRVIVWPEFWQRSFTSASGGKIRSKLHFVWYAAEKSRIEGILIGKSYRELKWLTRFTHQMRLVPWHSRLSCICTIAWLQLKPWYGDRFESIA